MGTINKRATPKTENAHLNWMGGKSFDIRNPILNLKLAASSCFFGEPMYYHRDEKAGDIAKKSNAKASFLSNSDINYLRETLDAIDPREWRSATPTKLMEDAIDKAIEYSIPETLKVAVELRNEDYIRVTPQVILVRVANHLFSKGTNYVSMYAPEIIKRADEPATGLAYQLSAFGKPIPNALKRAWRSFLSNQNEYSLAKYQQTSREVKLVDVINLTHPKSTAVDNLMKGKLSLTDRTWEAIISAEGSTKESWLKAIDVMGHMALLRNIRNILKVGIEPEKFIDKLYKGARYGKQLPFRYYMAYQENRNAPGVVLDAIEYCLGQSLIEMPHFNGRVISLSDYSGSAQGTHTSSLGKMRICDIGGLMGIITGKLSDDGYIGIFGDRLKVTSVRKNTSVFDDLSNVINIGYNIGMRTEAGIWWFWDNAIKNKEHWDSVFIYSDMQAGHGGLYGDNPQAYADFTWKSRHIDVSKLVSEYRSKVNPNVNVFLVQIAGYQDTIIPEFYNKTYILGGWSPNMLRFAGEMINLVQ